MSEKKVNLDGVLYHGDGTFKPLTDNYGNTDGKLSHLRNTYMESEKEYFEQLLSNKSILNTFKELLNHSTDYLFAYAIKLQEKLEYGTLETPEEKEKMESMSPEERDNFHMKKLEETEGLICLLFAATRDKVKILELVRDLPDVQLEEKSSARSR